MSNVNTQYRHAFVHVPKTGGTSMERQNFVGGSGHRSLFKMEAPDDFFRWGFVRHPGARLVSTYHAVTQHGGKQDTPPPMSFEDFVRKLHETGQQPIPGCRDHLIPQTSYLCAWPDKTKLMADFVGRFERMDRDWRWLCRCLRVPDVALKHLNASKHQPWREYYDAATWKLMAEIYASDFDVFRYHGGL